MARPAPIPDGSPSISEERVRAAVNSVTDPCSVGQAFPIGLVDMGMLTGVDIVPQPGGASCVTVHLRTTFPGCMYVIFFEQAVRTVLGDLGGVGDVSITWDASLDWTSDDMAPAVKARLAERRRRLAAASGRSPSGRV